ncbi:hypothetical protein C0Z12_00910 [Rothia aeria]|nr:hypothetical protein C0Z12_00910 [Rothia aeria]
MSAQEMDAEKAFERFESMLRDWLRDSGGTRIDIDYHAIHRTGFIINWLTIDGQRKTVRLPAKLDFTMYKLRPAQVDAHRGAWLYSHLWMEASDGVLHQESDWMREPVFDGKLMGEQDAAEELRLHPRDPEYIPEWMATKAAAFHKKEEARARRRERDRARRARKKAEAAQAAREAETNTSSTASEAAGKASS